MCRSCAFAHSAAVRASVAARLTSSRELHIVLGDEIDRPSFDLFEDLADIFADHAEHDELHAAEHHDADEQRRIAGHVFAIDQGLVDDLQAVDEGDHREHHAEHGGEPQRRHRERGQAVERQADQPAHIPGGAAVGARFRLVIDPHLAKADPARQALEEAIALRQLAQRIGRARRQQPEVAGIFRNLGARAPVQAAYRTPSRRRAAPPTRWRDWPWR